MLQARNTDPLSAHIAAARAGGCRKHNEDKIRAFLEEQGGTFTSREIAAALGMEYVTVSPLMRPMARKGLVSNMGLKKNPDTNSWAIAWGIGDGTPELFPALPTGPQEKLRLRLFQKIEVINLLSSINDGGDQFQALTDALNAELPKRTY